MRDEIDLETYSPVMSNIDIKNISELSRKLISLKADMIAAEENYKNAKKKYEAYAQRELPEAMLLCGVENITLDSGEGVSIQHNYYCSPNKNAEDMEIMAMWLRENGGEYLLKDLALVEDISGLRDKGIPFIEKHEVNTQSLKAFLKDKLGLNKGSTKVIDIEDIPACIHFSEVLEARINE